MRTQKIPNSDERIFAALAHGSVLLSFLGPIGPVIIWLSQRKKSKFASFHALQAMGFQVISFWLWLLLSILFPFLFMIFIFIGVFAFGDTSYFELFPLVFQGALFIGLFGIWGLYFLIGLVGLGFSLSGKDFRYPYLGKWLENYLETDDETENFFNEEHEDSWIAAVCHGTSAIFLWGITVPAVVWFSQKSRSLRLSFQAAQAAIYQTIAIIIYFIGTAFYMMLAFGFMAAFFIGSINVPGAQTEMPVWMGVIFLVFMALIGLLWLLALIATPVYFILSAFGSSQILRGHDFYYPIIGRFLAKRMNPALISIKKNGGLPFKSR